MTDFQPNACILCSRNCGIEVQIEDGRFKRVRGDKAHPVTAGYVCQKAGRLDYYQNHADRLRSPLRRRPDGSFEQVSWPTAIAEIAAKLVALRDQHGGHSLAYYGGGGQGNHLGGVYGSSLRAAMQTPYYYSALAQEKTGDFWVNGRLFGKQTCHISEDLEHTDFAFFLGTNPWQSHGIHNARLLLKKLSKDPQRTMVVVDPRRTETAELADIHLQLKPGTDAYLLSAMLATWLEEDLVDMTFIDQHTEGLTELQSVLQEVPIDDFCRRAGLEPATVREVARGLARAQSACVRADLGIQHSRNSTLNSYLEKLLFLLSGNLGNRGGNVFHSFMLPLIGHTSEKRALHTRVTKMREISKLFPPNVLPAEIDNDQPDRLRGLVVDSANPALSGADTGAYTRAFERLELLVVIDVAMTETARHAHYVLPASSQFEKWEATFFNLDFPTNYFHLRRPIMPPLPGTLPEPEIYRRLVVAMGALPERFPLLERIARLDRKLPRMRLFQAALGATLALRKDWRALAPMLLYATLGKALPDGAAAAAVLWYASHQYASRHAPAMRRVGFSESGYALGEELFAKILSSPSGLLISKHDYPDTWDFIKHPDKRVHLAIPELLAQLRALGGGGEGPQLHDDFPFVLLCGERRSYNANTIYRDPRWRRTDKQGALRIHPEDAAALGIDDDARVRVRSRRGSLEASVHVCDSLRRGVVSLPHGYGMEHPGADGRRATGPSINWLTDAADRDPIAGTPYHKYVPVRLELLKPAEKPALAVAQQNA